MLSEFWHGTLNFKKMKHLKKIREELMPVVRYPKKWSDFYMSEDEKKEIEPIFNDKCC